MLKRITAVCVLIVLFVVFAAPVASAAPRAEPLTWWSAIADWWSAAVAFVGVPPSDDEADDDQATATGPLSDGPFNTTNSAGEGEGDTGPTMDPDG